MTAKDTIKEIIMSQLNEILSYNNGFIEQKKYEAFATTKFPDKKMVILTCMDTRLIRLLPEAMNLKKMVTPRLLRMQVLSLVIHLTLQ